jgi:hypothetical protein
MVKLRSVVLLSGLGLRVTGSPSPARTGGCSEAYSLPHSQPLPRLPRLHPGLTSFPKYGAVIQTTLP